MTDTVQEAIDLKFNDRPDGGPVFPTGDVRNPEVFEIMAKPVEGKHFKNRGLTTVDLPKYVEYLQPFVEFRFDEISVHVVNRN